MSSKHPPEVPSVPQTDLQRALTRIYRPGNQPPSEKDWLKLKKRIEKNKQKTNQEAS